MSSSSISSAPIDNRIFKIKSFSPVGFKKIKYEPNFCPICRGSLNDVCNECSVSKIEICPVQLEDTINYHGHCFYKCSDKLKKKEEPKKKKADSDEEEVRSRRNSMLRDDEDEEEVEVVTDTDEN